MIEIGINDIVIPATSLMAVGFAVHFDDPKWKRWSPVIGLIGQPFWIYESWTAQTWGIFVLSIAYLFIWITGIMKYWFGIR